MRPFSYSRADSVQAAIGAQAPSELPPDAATVHAPNQFVAGGTTLIDLMKLDVMRPRNIIDINALERRRPATSSLGRAASISAPWCACLPPPNTRMCGQIIQ
jgi:xanthine dehydrogenase YagS FAD-binding subunit